MNGDIHYYGYTEVLKAKATKVRLKRDKLCAVCGTLLRANSSAYKRVIMTPSGVEAERHYYESKDHADEHENTLLEATGLYEDADARTATLEEPQRLDDVPEELDGCPAWDGDDDDEEVADVGSHRPDIAAAMDF